MQTRFELGVRAGTLQHAGQGRTLDYSQIEWPIMLA